MTKTPSALKWLAERRARVAHEVAQTGRLATLFTEQLAVLTQDLAALDRAIGIYDPAIDPSSIGAVNGWRGTYGTRGALRAAVMSALTTCGPGWASISSLETIVTSELGLAFETPSIRLRWYRNSFKPALKKLMRDETVERRDDADQDSGDGDISYWRIKSTGAKSVSLADLQLQAQA